MLWGTDPGSRYDESQCIILWAGEPRLAMSQSKGEKSHSQNVGLHVQLCHLGSTDYIRNDTVDRYQIRCPGRGPRPSRGLPLSDAPSAPSGHEPFSPFFPATWKSLLFQSHLLSPSCHRIFAQSLWSNTLFPLLNSPPPRPCLS